MMVGNINVVIIYSLTILIKEDILRRVMPGIRFAKY